MTVERKFNCKAVELLIVGETIVTIAATHQAELADRRASFIPAYFDKLKTDINNAYPNILGINNKQQLKDATQLLTNIAKPASTDLVDFNKQISFDFRKDATRLKQLKSQLGFAAHYEKLKTRDQEGLIELLNTFKTSMTPTLKTEITTAGTDTNLIDRITTYAQNLKDANVTQEVAKASSKELTQQDIAVLNEIYEQLILINDIARRSKLSSTAKKSFSFGALLKKLNRQGNTNADTPTPNNTPETK